MAGFPFLPAVANALGDPMTLAKLVAQSQSGGPSVPQPMAPNPNAPPPPAGHVVSPADAVQQEEPEIVVQNEPYPKSKYRNGIVQGGTFRLGGLGGNILGALGDAFLTQAGQAPQYRPRLQQARISEAMEGFQQDPERAIAMLMQIDPEAAAKLTQQNFENGLRTNEDRRQDTELEQTGQVRGAQVRQATTQTDQIVNDRALAMLGVANAQNWPAIRQRVLAYYKANNMVPPFELPESFDDAAVQAMRMSTVPVGTQIELTDRRNFNNGQLANQRMGMNARNTQAQAAVTRANRPPAQRPQTTGNVMAAILDKIARNEPLNPGEQRLYTDYTNRGRRPQTGGGGGGWVKNPQTGRYERRTS